MTEQDTRTEAGRWAGLAVEGGRLQALYQERRLEEVLSAVQGHRSTVVTLADPPDGDAGVPGMPSWAIRESLLGLGVVAAHDLGRWATALALNSDIARSQEERKAPEAERAVTWFNDYGPLLRLGRARDAREILFQCRAAFGRAEDITMMGNTLSALANAEAQLGHLDHAVEHETDALRMKYRGTDPEAVAVSHFNLSNYLVNANQDLRAAWAHRVAAAVIRYQTDSPRLVASVDSIGRLIGQEQDASTKAPVTFNDVCQMVDGVPGVRFAELFATLPERAATGQAALVEVMRLTTDKRATAVADSVEAWEPIISGLVAAARPDPDPEVGPLLDDVLAELRKQEVWRELVVVLYRLQAGPDHVSDTTFDQLDSVSATVSRRALAALTGEVDVDPTLWRTMLEDN